jgi:stage III sporulation protein AG
VKKVSKEKEKKNILELITKFWQGGGKEGRKKNYLLLSFLLLGIVLMFSSSFFTPRQRLSDVRDNGESLVFPTIDLQKDDERELTEALQGILEHINGISNVRVFISFNSTEEIVYAQTTEDNVRETTEVDREGGRREIYESNNNSDYVILRDAGGGEKPLQLTKKMPLIKGILVVANGAENASLRLKVVRAIESVLELPTHRIAVLPRGSQ